jgi:hypothetical protein
MTNDNSRPEDLLEHSDLVQKDTIQILLNEYSTLRSEILSRTGFGFQLASIAFAVTAFLLTQIIS